jgi:hypothetical protein
MTTRPSAIARPPTADSRRAMPGAPARARAPRVGAVRW